MGRDGTAVTFVTEWDFPALDSLMDSLSDELKPANVSLYEPVKVSR